MLWDVEGFHSMSSDNNYPFILAGGTALGDCGKHRRLIQVVGERGSTAGIQND